jgi:hypothetical protein
MVTHRGSGGRMRDRGSSGVVSLRGGWLSRVCDRRRALGGGPLCASACGATCLLRKSRIRPGVDVLRQHHKAACWRGEGQPVRAVPASHAVESRHAPKCRLYVATCSRGRARRKKPAVGFDDSRLKVNRLIHKTYYAHFRIKVKPGSLLTYKGFMALRVPIQVPGGELTGWNYSGQCAAR